MAQNKFDPEAAREFQRTIREKLLDPIETQLMTQFEEGKVLSREPRWGTLPDSAAAQGTYSTFHSTTWQNLETTRAALYGMLEQLDAVIDQYAGAEDATVAEHESYGDALS